ncbi:hypothetical protein [Microvirga subterranea]|uniref:Flagellar FliJ protein n=1 Tax=Microvirga subterranea TaxID=186651 RepID=A0A370H360_9HYPH|nr:hypothetical protein [Microvirga subterranea]RDI50405.1 hypothetical protein DES45_1216 [Microvirga subterranea]
MDKRLQKTKRLLKVQEQLHQIAEWKLASLQRQVAELQNTQHALIATLNDDQLLHGLFVEARSRRLQTLAAEEGRVKVAEAEQKKAALDHAMQVKRTERMVETLSVEYRRAVEKKDYLALLDSLATKTDASLP